MKIKVNITKDVLRESMYCAASGKKNETWIGQNCAIGKAIVNLFGNKSWVEMDKILVFKELINWDNQDAKYSEIPLPFEASMFISDFDSFSNAPDLRLEMEPLSFEIDVPDEVIDQIGIDEVHKILEETPSLDLA